MNAMTIMTSIAMVLVSMAWKRICGNAMINAFLNMSLVKMNVLNIISTAMVLVLKVGKCGNAMMNAFIDMNLVKKNAMTLVTSSAMVFVSEDGKKTYGNVMINAYL
jgi:hypothetical protein